MRPLAGHGCVSWKSRLAEAERGCLAEAETGSATQMESKTQMGRAVLMDRRTLHIGRQQRVSVPVNAVVQEASCSLAAQSHQ